MTILSSSLVSTLARVACVTALGLPLFCAGCTDVSCFEWTEPEGACPAQDEALLFFQDPSCPGSSPIESVDGEGDFDDDACCYAVTKSSNDDYYFDCFGNEGGVVGAAAVTVSGVTAGGGFTGAVTSSVGVGGMGGFGGAGGAGAGGSSCTLCAAALSGGDTSNMCPGSQFLFTSLNDCQCNGACAGTCGAECMDGQPMSMECQQCTTDAMMGCGMQFDACSNDA